ncbi:hypothetical protein V8E54_007847 [Elaphomyces granulatus]
MANLSQDDRDVIVNHPLNNSLDRLQDLLRDTEKSYESRLISYDGAVENPGQTYQKAISRLLGTLLIEDTAFNLRSKTSSRNVASELSFLFGRIQNDDFNYEHYRALSQLVIRKAQNVDIWNAVFDLITTISRLTPSSAVPLSAIPPSFDSTPITHSSVSQPGGEQTREVVERKIFEEIRFCTYRDVEGFFEKYFEGKEWTRRALDVYEAMKDRHVDGMWTDLPNPPVQAEVLDWWFRFQDDFLSEEQRRYHSTTKPKELVGAEAQRQIDLFIRRNNGQPPHAAHDWRDVEVIGNDKKKGTLLQIGRYVRDVFSCQPTRRYVHAFTICGRDMEVWIFDRSGCYSPGSFNIHEEPKRFIQVIAGYTMMNEEELGLDTFTEQDGEHHFICVEQDGIKSRKRPRLESKHFTHQRAIVCRGTSCYLTKAPESEECYQVFMDIRQTEADLPRLARSRGVEGIATLIGHGQRK